jgi:metal-dependent HD superfamily phosphatase/phosphodiesterase
MKLEFKPTLEMRASAKHAEAALSLANDIVDRVLHEDVHDNPQLVVGVMIALAENFAALTIRGGLDDIASAIRESTMH